MTVSPGKENPERCKIYIFKVPKRGHPGVSTDAKDMSIMNSFIKDIFEKLAGSVPATCRACRVRARQRSEAYLGEHTA